MRQFHGGEAHRFTLPFSDQGQPDVWCAAALALELVAEMRCVPVTEIARDGFGRKPIVEPPLGLRQTQPPQPLFGGDALERVFAETAELAAGHAAPGGDFVDAILAFQSQLRPIFHCGESGWGRVRLHPY